MRKQPFVSMANLVEYATTSSAARRRQLIEQYQNPEVIRFDWHGASDTIFAQRACGSASADNLIDLEKRRIREQMIGGDQNKDKRSRHILHLIDLLEASDLLRLTDGTDASVANELSADLQIGELTVRVRPNLVLSGKQLGRKYPERGILKCHNLTTFKLSENAGRLYAIGLQIYAEEIFGADNVRYDLCRAYDLSEDRIHQPPKNQKRLRTQLFDAAQEILDRWDAVGRRLAGGTKKLRKAS